MGPATIKIRLVDGDPDGLRVATKSNWNGEAVVCPRRHFAEAKTRKEFNRPGVYVLVAPTSEQGSASIYIGEADPVRPRLERHNLRNRDWTFAVTFTSSSENLNKAHIQYLEARLVEEAKNANRCKLENKKAPQRPTLPEADEEEMEGFLREMLLVYTILGVSAFESAKNTPPDNRLFIKAKGITASGYEVQSKFNVTKGSEAVRKWTASAEKAKYGPALRDELVGSRVLTLKGDRYEFAQDYLFRSPSSAAQIIQGRSANGLIDWKDERGKTLKQLREKGKTSTTRS